MGVRPDAPTIETIVWVTFYEIIKDENPNFILDLKISGPTRRIKERITTFLGIPSRNPAGTMGFLCILFLPLQFLTIAKGSFQRIRR
jgi:hypothetical protein